jgi:hypothetical protein
VRSAILLGAIATVHRWGGGLAQHPVATDLVVLDDLSARAATGAVLIADFGAAFRPRAVPAARRPIGVARAAMGFCVAPLMGYGWAARELPVPVPVPVPVPARGRRTGSARAGLPGWGAAGLACGATVGVRSRRWIGWRAARTARPSGMRRFHDG